MILFYMAKLQIFLLVLQFLNNSLGFSRYTYEHAKSLQTCLTLVTL